MPIRQIMVFLRAAGLMQVADLLLFAGAYLKNLPTNRRFFREFPTLPLPPPYMLYESFRLDYQKYWESGRETACWIKTKTESFIPKVDSLHILDWGCGPARVLRHLPEIFEEENVFHGTDYNHKTVDWCRNNLQNISISDCPLLPPAPYADNDFDLIYGISVFTHLPEHAHYQWRDELYRIAKPGAVLLWTTQGPAVREKMTREEQEVFNGQQLLVRGNTKSGHRTFSAFHPERWTRSFFADRFEILQYIPGKKESWGIAQDTWILRRP